VKINLESLDKKGYTFDGLFSNMLLQMELISRIDTLRSVTN
jgi:hypothetical protein